MPLPEGEVVYAQGPHLPGVGKGTLIALSSKGVAADDETELRCNGTRPSAELQDDRKEHLLHPVRLRARAATSSSLSQKILRPHEASSQKKRLAKTLELHGDPVPGQVGDPRE